MTQPLKSCSRSASVAWCAADAAPSLLALGTSAANAASAITGGPNADPALDFVAFDPVKPASDMDIVASVRTEGRRFSSISWGSLGSDGPFPYGIVAGGLQDGVVSYWNPHAVVNSRGADQGVIHSGQVHNGSVNCLEFHPVQSRLLATCGADSEVHIMNLERPNAPQQLEPSTGPSKHAGTEVLCCAWNRTVQHILCSCSNAGTTVVWDLKQKKEVISFKDPASRQRCSAVVWHPEVPTQLLVAYDDDRHPSMQMWDLRNCQYPFKENAGHTKGILDVAWNTMDPNLVLSCGKDNKIICWCLSGGSMDTFCEMPSQQGNYSVRWAPHRPGIFAATSMSGSVNIHSVQTQQSASTKYCPRWYGKTGGVSFGFGARMMSFGTKKAASLETPAAKPTNSWCHSLVVPNEPEIVPTADNFERWIANRKLREFCHDKTQRIGGPAEHEGLMWELMGTQFEGETGRTRVASLLGFEGDSINQEAERFLGQRPGSLLGPQAEEQSGSQAPGGGAAAPAPISLGPELDVGAAESFFEELSATTEQKRIDEQEKQQRNQMAEALGASLAATGGQGSTKTDWSMGPEALIKKSLLVGNLSAAVECCFKSGRMAEGLLLASGGGTLLWTRARDEYLRLQGDPFLSTVGNIMTDDFEKLVSTSNLGNWKETLAILATYSGNQYQNLCLQLANRLEKEKFDIRSAVICYICAGNFEKTVSIWSNTHIGTQGSPKLALQDLVEKMAVLQEATKFNKADAIFNAKLTQYAEILANSGRLTAAMRYLCLLRDDSSSSILRERIYNSCPQQMSELFGRPPTFPFEVLDLRVAYQPPAPAAPAHAPGPAAPHHAQQHKAGMPIGAPNSMGGNLGPRPNMPTHGAPGPANPMPPRPNVPAYPSMPHAVGAGHAHMPAMPAPAPIGSNMPPRPNVSMGGQMGGPYGGGQPVHHAPVAPSVPHHPSAAPVASHNVLPPSGHSPVANTAPPAMPPGRSTAPQAAAAPVVSEMPVSWPIATKTQQRGSTTTSVAGANAAIQELSVGGALSMQGEPMAPHDLTQVRNILGMLLETSGQDGNVKKKEDNAKRLEDLYSKLAAGQVKVAASQKLLDLVRKVEAQDYASVSRLAQELYACDWEQNKNWLMAIKRLMPTR